MKQELLLKTGLLMVAIFMIGTVWFGFQTIDDQATMIDSLTQKVKRQKDQIKFLKASSKQESRQTIQSESKNIEETVNVFVQSLYQVKKDQLDKRRENAKEVLTQDMFQEYFPAEEKDGKIQYEYEIGESTVYTRVHGENGSAIVTFEETMESLANGRKENSKITLEVNLQKEGSKWLVNRFQQINAESF
ncbi:hypothetical protein M1K46_11760 [Fictibacillus sp. WQ 8-8]|uniref:hypothetical protein n=1 Tax=Fictibacillus sp. WQ 8-8 TaxID=2938788 RepID=UPI00210AF7B7|nr:hypothetical protein [Fictibacillus sp. WQ 8-8]MCQ6266333.1 hypothetical protein [Fictibacillus sp. WQ 8-8]